MQKKRFLGLCTRAEDPKRFWLQLCFAAMLIWLLSGLISFITLSASAEAVIKVLIGIAPCWLLLFACLCLAEIKRKTPPLEKKQQLLEDLILVLFGVLAVLAEILHLFSEGISFALPLTVASLLVSAIIRIGAPRASDKKESGKGKNALNSRFSMGDIMKIIIMGILTCIILAKFYSDAIPILMQFA